MMVRWVGEGEWGGREEAGDGGGGGNHIWYAVETSRDAVDTCGSCQLYN